MSNKQENCLCGQERRAKCPACHKFAKVVNNAFVNHEVPICKDSHMEYKTCPRSSKPAPPFVAHIVD